MSKPAVKWSTTPVTTVEKTLPLRTSLVKALLVVEDDTTFILDMESARRGVSIHDSAYRPSVSGGKDKYMLETMKFNMHHSKRELET